MKKIADLLTGYIGRKGIIKEEDYPIYTYGFQYGLELGACFVICFMITALMGVLWEEIIFWLIFFCVRSYVGGFHFKKYMYCFVCSCSVGIGLPMFNKYFPLDRNIALFFSLIFGFILLKSMMKQNNHLEEQEFIFFKSQLKKRLYFIFLGSIILYLLKTESMLSMVTYSLLAILVSIILNVLLSHKKEITIE